MVVFKGAKREVAALKQEFQHQAVVALSANGWMDTELTKMWVDSVLGSFAFNRRLLAWDSFECHMEDSITESLKSNKIDRVIVPGGCSKYIQAPNVSWNKPFKSLCTEKYNEWLGTVGNNEENAAGNLSAPQDELYYNRVCLEPPCAWLERRHHSLFQRRATMQHGESYASDATGYLEGTRCKSFRVHRFRCGRGLPSHAGARRF